MARQVRSPSKIFWGLRFESKCIICGRVISSDRTLCSRCARKAKNTFGL